jgi:2-haloacid dehalogenase
MNGDLTAIRAILFDLYGTLLDVRSVEAACAGVAADAAAFTQLWRAKQLEYTFLRTLMGRYVDFWQVTRDALEHTAERFGVALDPARREALMAAWLRLASFPDAPEALAALDGAGRTLGVLSNGSPPMLDAALAHSGLRAHFAHVLSADAVRVYKPHSAVYQLGCDALGLLPHQVLFVSSNGFDVAGAAHFGFAVCWANRAGVPADRLDQIPRLQIRSLGELVAALRGPL